MKESARSVNDAQIEYKTAKYMYFLHCAEQSSGEKHSSHAWQEMQRHATHRLKQTRTEYIEKKSAYMVLYTQFEEMVKNYLKMKKKLKHCIQKSR